MKREVNRKGQGAIISVVLLILIVVALAVIVMAFVIPFVKDKLSSGDCLDVINKVEISSSDYTCYDSDNTKMHVQVHIGAVRDLISGFSVELGGAASKTFKIINSTTGITDITMYGGGVPIELPGDNEERTYVFSGISNKPDSIKVYPILENGKLCDASGVVTTIENC